MLTSHDILVVMTMLVLQLTLFTTVFSVDIRQCDVDTLNQTTTGGDNHLCYVTKLQQCENVTSSDVRLTSRPVQNLSVKSSHVPPPPDIEMNHSRSQLSVQWTMSLKSVESRDGIQFEVRRTLYSRSEVSSPRRSDVSRTCVKLSVVNLDKSPGVADDAEIQVIYEDNEELAPGVYLVQVLNQSLGQASGSPLLVPHALINVMPKDPDLHPEYRVDRRRWTVDTVVLNDSCSRSVSVWFELAPAAFGFTGYTVLLAPIDFSDRDVHISMQIVEVGPRVNGDKCNDCINSMSATFLMLPVTEVNCSLTLPPQFTKYHVIAMCLGVVSAVVILLLIACFCYARHILGVVNPQVHAPDSRRRLLVIYETDSDQHVRAVRQLSTLVGRRCNMDVVADFTCVERVRLSKGEFVIWAVTEAHAALVVISPALRAAWRAQRDDNWTSTTESRSVNQLLLQHLRTHVGQLGAEPVHDNIVAARFHYTPSDVNVDTQLALTRHVWELPRDVDGLVLAVHGLTAASMIAAVLPCICRVTSNDDRTQLESAVELVQPRHHHSHHNEHLSEMSIDDDDESLEDSTCLALQTVSVTCVDVQLHRVACTSVLVESMEAESLLADTHGHHVTSPPSFVTTTSINSLADMTRLNDDYDDDVAITTKC